MTKTYYFYGLPNTTTIANAVLANVKVLNVTREGTTYYKGVGTPNNFEYVYYPGSATIIFHNQFYDPRGPRLRISDLEKVSVKVKI